ncbi:MAG TPA: YraN family protein [Candidatus Margulisiibacteriota bacterium]|nr:YraN family protein [Candidatus Margulisiibacteriota bacterium]
MSKQGLNLGRRGEELAVELLKKNGYQIIARNHKSSLGEIDIIAKDKDTLCFIEVKTRRSDKFGSGLEAVSHFKQRQISKVALEFLKEKNLLESRARFDVVAVSCKDAEPKLELCKDAFELNQGYTY